MTPEMLQRETIVNEAAKVKFFTVFNKCQGLLDPVKPDSVNDHFGNRYPSLAAVMNAIKPFIEAGFSFIHEGVVVEGKTFLKTSLIYGDYQRESLWPMTDDGNPQHLASSMTYGKRYSISGLTGLVIDSDDDGNAASAAKAPIAHAAVSRVPEASGFEVAKFVPSKVEFVDGKGKGAGKTFSEIYRPDGAKFSGNELQGELALEAQKSNKEILVAFERRGNYMNIKRDGVKLVDTPRVEAEVPF